MSITYLYTQALPNSAANSGAVLGLCEALSHVGAAPAIVFPGAAGDSPVVRGAYGLSDAVGLIPVRPARGPGFYPSLAWITPAGEGQVTITRSPQVAVVSAALGRSTILELHQHLTTFSNWRWWRMLLAFVQRNRLSVAALTPALVADMDPALERKAKDVAVIPSGAPDFGEEAGRATHDVGYVGSFKRGKGVEIIEQLARRRPEVRFLIVGDPAGDPAQASRLSDLPNVDLAGFVARSEMAAQMRRFRIGLAPYAAAGFSGGEGEPVVSSDSLSSMKIAEYLSAGRAVIASAIPSVEAMVDHEVEALLCPCGDEESWLAALDRLIGSNDLCRDLAQAGRRRFLDEFSMPARAGKFLALARRLSDAQVRP